MLPSQVFMKACKPILFGSLLLITSTTGVMMASDGWRDKSPHKTQYVTINGVQLHCLDWGGRGDPLVMLHGTGDTAHIFDDLAPKLTNQFRVLALTRRGHGQSAIPTTGYDRGTRVDDIRQFLDRLRIPRTILAGHSAAGGEVTLFAGTYPDRVIKLVYFDAIYDSDARLKILEEMPIELSQSATDASSLDSTRKWLKSMNDSWSDAWEATLRTHFSGDGKTFLDSEKRLEALRSMIEQEGTARQDYTKIRVPVLSFAVVGFPSNMLNRIKRLPEPRRKLSESFLNRVEAIKENEGKRFRKEITDGRFVVFTNVDHHCFIERESDVINEMRKFLSTP